MRKKNELSRALRQMGMNVYANEFERIERLFLDGSPHSPGGGCDNPDTIMAPGGVEISLVDPLPEILTIVLGKTKDEQRELLEQLKA